MVHRTTAFSYFLVFCIKDCRHLWYYLQIIDKLLSKNAYINAENNAGHLPWQTSLPKKRDNCKKHSQEIRPSLVQAYFWMKALNCIVKNMSQKTTKMCFFFIAIQPCNQVLYKTRKAEIAQEIEQKEQQHHQACLVQLLKLHKKAKSTTLAQCALV